jgi:hypothetical protein
VTARELKDVLAKRHPATGAVAVDGAKMLGPWTVLEEWQEVDLLAISANSSPPSGARRGVKYPRVGYEVKVTRSDMRRELLAPSKRKKAQLLCSEFYFAVPKGLLKPEELEWEEPEWEHGDFHRRRCDGNCSPAKHLLPKDAIKELGFKSGTHLHTDPSQLANPRDWLSAYSVCETCKGRGWLEKSRVEREAPTLWIPRDVGLVEVTEHRTTVVRKSPLNDSPRPLEHWEVGDLVRWVSARPDPRHEGIVEDLRKVAKDERDRRRHYRENYGQ